MGTPNCLAQLRRLGLFGSLQVNHQYTNRLIIADSSQLRQRLTLCQCRREPGYRGLLRAFAKFARRASNGSLLHHSAMAKKKSRNDKQVNPCGAMPTMVARRARLGSPGSGFPGRWARMIGGV